MKVSLKTTNPITKATYVYGYGICKIHLLHKVIVIVKPAETDVKVSTVGNTDTKIE